MPKSAMPPRQARFVTAMVTAPTVPDAARQAGISVRTAQRYLHDPDVQAALGRAFDDSLIQVTRQVNAALGRTLSVLEAIVDDPHAPTHSRVAAARLLLDAGIRLRQTLDLAQRVNSLEEKQRSLTLNAEAPFGSVGASFEG